MPREDAVAQRLVIPQQRGVSMRLPVDFLRINRLTPCLWDELLARRHYANQLWRLDFAAAQSDPALSKVSWSSWLTTDFHALWRRSGETGPAKDLLAKSWAATQSV